MNINDISINAYSYGIMTKEQSKAMLHKLLNPISSRITSDKSGQGIVEYGIVLAVVALLLIGPLGGLRDTIINKLNEASKTISGMGKAN